MTVPLGPASGELRLVVREVVGNCEPDGAVLLDEVEGRASLPREDLGELVIHRSV